MGKVSFDAQRLKENVQALLHDLQKAKPSTAKGVYMKRVSLSTTMGPGISVDMSTLGI
jgi:large subunit ribosomal protein L1